MTGTARDDRGSLVRRSARDGRTNVAQRPWSTLEPAVEVLGGRLVPAGTAGCRILDLPGLPEALFVSLDLGLARFRWRYSLGACPTNDQNWAYVLAAAHISLSLFRFALTHRGLALVTETAVAGDEETMVEVLSLLLADLTAGWVLYRESSRGGLSEDQPVEEHPWPRVSSQNRTAAQRSVSAWLQESAAAGWQAISQNGGWRLVRTPWASSGLPPVCHLRMEQATLAAESMALLPDTASPEICQALGLFLLQQNARCLARAGLDIDGIPPTVKIESNWPLVGLESLHVAKAVDTVIAAYDALRWEVEALCGPAVAQFFLRIAYPRLIAGCYQG